MMCRKLSIFLLVLLLASASAWAFPGRQTGSRETEAIAISVPEAQEEALNPDSGNQAETISTEPQTSYVVQEASAKVEAGKRLTADEADAILAELDAAKTDFAALEETSKAKDSTIDDLTAENLKLKDETGTKAYLMLDGIIGFSEGYPEYGVGLTVGTRLGNSLMLELGADYMLGGNLADLMDFSIDDFTFRAGIGWMF